MKKGFEGWYFKHQKEDDVIAFIPGKAESGSFIQVITKEGSRQFDMPELMLKHGVIYAGSCVFSARGCKIGLPGVSGELFYHDLTPLRSDIMGPFQYLPMQCRHGVISMAHSLQGSIRIDGQVHDFSGGKGYIEKDSGSSFPRAYTWIQCNDFAEPCSVMVSIAHIPFGGVSFTGCICAIFYNRQEYRLATYRGVRVRQADANRICLTQGKLRLEMEMLPSQTGHSLRAPVMGSMSAVIRESSNAKIRLRLWERNRMIIDLESSHAMYEFVPELG